MKYGSCDWSSRTVSICPKTTRSGSVLDTVIMVVLRERERSVGESSMEKDTDVASPRSAAEYPASGVRRASKFAGSQALSYGRMTSAS